ncbi:hypothetical protein O181_075614 [Austropuccinia psidii MF-1]|uniref:Integrase zinc-binding domain-containing protein n=1 Tax=Austropuccinia psidii MF-1 TaxID=1389203 RepID=A0A9Q3IEM5_9BASI|nr:hypothetical protein [Austropuccinia psidii MF-1]
MDAHDRIKHELTIATVLILPDCELPFKLYIDAREHDHHRKEGKIDPNGDGLRGWPLDNVKSNPAYSLEVEAKIPIHFMEIDWRKNFKFSEWAPESGTIDSENTDSEGTETPILGIRLSDRNNEFFNAVIKAYAKHKQCGMLFQLLQEKYRSPELESWLEEPCALTIIDRDNITLILQEFHDCTYMGHMSEDRTKERVARTAWWPKWEQ